MTKTSEMAANISDRRILRLWAIRCAKRVVDNIHNYADQNAAKRAIIAAEKFLAGEIDADEMQRASNAADKAADAMEARDTCVSAEVGRPQIDAALAAAAAASTNDARLNFAGWHAANSIYNVALDEHQHDSEVAQQLMELGAIASGAGS